MSLKNILGSIPFGKIDDGSVSVSYGIGGAALVAKDKDGNFRSYNAADKSIDITPVELQIAEFPAFAIPVDAKALVAGDLILYNGKDLGYFAGLDADGNNKIIIDIKSGEAKTFVPTKSLFGFNFVAKIVSPLSGFAAPGADGATSAIDPNMLIMMSMLGNGDLFGGDGDGDGNSMLPLLLMTGGLGGTGGAGPLGALGSNPLLLVLLMKGAL